VKAPSPTLYVRGAEGRNGLPRLQSVGRIGAAVGRASVGSYRLFVRARAKTFSLLSSGAFASFGARSVIELPVRLAGEARIAIGEDVYVGGGSWLQTLDGPGHAGVLEIGDGTSIAGSCVVSAARSVRIGRKVLVARNVYISDHIHAYDDPTKAVLEQGIERLEPVEIGDGAWLGQNVVVCPGVTIGRGAVIGANAVVLGDVPEHTLAVGVPATVVRRFALEQEVVS
jgi:acetyltransferase-like isoleucine patch superfamily enzyme